MKHIDLKQQKDSSSKYKGSYSPTKANSDKPFVLSDVSKEELEKRRIPSYPYLM